MARKESFFCAITQRPTQTFIQKEGKKRLSVDAKHRLSLTSISSQSDSLKSQIREGFFCKDFKFAFVCLTSYFVSATTDSSFAK